MRITLASITEFNGVSSTTTRVINTDDIEIVSPYGSGSSIVVKNTINDNPDLIISSDNVAAIVALATDGSLHTIDILELDSQSTNNAYTAAIASKKVFMAFTEGSNTRLQMASVPQKTILISEVLATYTARYNALSLDGNTLDTTSLDMGGASSVSVSINRGFLSEEFELPDGKLLRVFGKNSFGGRSFSFENSGYDVILGIGQSNMNGSTQPPVGHVFSYSGNVFQITRASEGYTIIPAVHPLFHQQQVANTVSPLLYFAEEYQAKYNVQVLLVPAGFGGTGLADGGRWVVGTGDLYLEAINRTNLALANNSGNTLRCIYWIQGGNDINTPQAQYETNLDAMIQGFYAAFASAGVTRTNCPFLMGGSPTYARAIQSDPNGFIPMDTIRDTPNRETGTIYVSNLMLDTKAGDEAHYSFLSMVEQGLRASAVYNKFRLNEDIVPFAPRMEAPVVGSGTVTLRWATAFTLVETDLIDYEISYENLASPGVFTTVTQVPAITHAGIKANTSVVKESITINSLSDGATYNFRVRARNAQGFSAYSTVANVVIGSALQTFRLDMETSLTDAGPNGETFSGTLLGSDAFIADPLTVRSGFVMTTENAQLYAGRVNSSYALPADSFTIMGWFARRDDGSPDNIEMFIGGTATVMLDNATFHFFYDRLNTRLVISLEGTVNLASLDSNLSVTHNFTMTNDTWYHLAARYNIATGVATIFVNGQPEASGNVGTGFLGTAIRIINGKLNNGTNQFVGLADNVQGYEGVQSDQDILDIYNAETP